MTTRLNTPDLTLPDGSTRITVKRCCNGCGRSLGDVTDAEMDACISGAPLPDVTTECGCGPAGAHPIIQAVRAFYDGLADTDAERLADLDVVALVEDLGRLVYPDQHHLTEEASA